jgi:hypothetical protein
MTYELKYNEAPHDYCFYHITNIPDICDIFQKVFGSNLNYFNNCKENCKDYENNKHRSEPIGIVAKW